MTPLPRTPDQRYIIVDGILWRATRPDLPEAERQALVKDLMASRRAVRDARDDPVAMRSARAWVQSAKVALGERGPPWWDDGAPDFNRHRVANTPYCDWWASAKLQKSPEARSQD